MKSWFRKSDDLAFEDALNDDWSHDLDMVEVPLNNRPLLYVGVVVVAIILAVLGQVVYLGLVRGPYYAARAEGNAAQADATPAPRGMIYDAQGNVVADNKAVFTATLDANEFLSQHALQSSTLAAAEDILGVPPDTVQSLLEEASKQDFATPIVLGDDLTSEELVNLQALNLPTITIQSNFERDYPKGPVFSSVVGYTGWATQADLEKNPQLTTASFVGRAGIEAEYDSTLQGVPGIDLKFRNAKGAVLGEAPKSMSTIGAPLHLTIDGGLQTYFYTRLQNGLASLGRTVGLGLAIDPQTGKVLSLINLPGFDDNVFSQPSENSSTIRALLTSSARPLFDRVVSGFYNPGSTIKPLDGVAALKEGVIDSTREIYSPGYLMVPNPYDPSAPTKYLDWQPQGHVNLASALAQSSDVYFYIVGGGSPSQSTPELNDPSDYGIGGLGISKLDEWWQKFGLGKTTGIDMPNEAAGFLPTPQWKQQKTGKPWLLGDTYNVSIGQGDLLLTPVQLLDYIGAIANGGTVWKPFLNASSTPEVAEDLTSLAPQIAEVQKGMRAGVTSPRGTSHTLNDLSVPVCAKTGSAQVQNNTQENALFVGYMPCDHPQIVLLILIENSKQGSLNAVPIAHDVLDWYIQNRLHQ